jgi:hypothetical protein
VSPYALALVLAALGETPRAIEALGRALDEGDPAAIALQSDPRLATLRRDARFSRVMRRLMP